MSDYAVAAASMAGQKADEAATRQPPHEQASDRKNSNSPLRQRDASSSVDRKDKRDSVTAKSRPSKSGSSSVERTPKKRRKVNHACIYCRRSHMTCDLERPCTRCIKRNISHLCRDEPRDADSRKSKSVAGSSVMGESEHQHGSVAGSTSHQSQQHQQRTRQQHQQQQHPPEGQQPSGSMAPPSPFDQLDSHARQNSRSSFSRDDVLGQGAALQNLVRQSPHARLHGNPLTSGNLGQFAGFSDAWLSTQNQLNGLNPYHASYMIAPEVTDEFNLLDNFLHTSLLDDGAQLADALSASPALARQNQAEMLPGFHNINSNNNSGVGGGAVLPPGQRQGSAMLPPISSTDHTVLRAAAAASAPPPGGDTDKARREYYLEAADPSGNATTPEERMQRLLKAKYDAGMLRPFNYIKGYHRLSTYLDRNISAASKQKILRTLNQFRPKFREKAQGLTDMELVFVEMWFEKQLMEYDRVFASMAVPSCLWRRTGEIYRGNKEMAELIGVPVEHLRDGRLALHEILTEDSVVRYWEEFQTIAFDPDHDSLLTACTLKNPEDKNEARVNCAFSFVIKRDEHKLPTIIVGNFLPHDPPEA